MDVNPITEAWHAATPEQRADFVTQVGGVAMILDSASAEQRAEFIRFASNTHLLTK